MGNSRMLFGKFNLQEFYVKAIAYHTKFHTNAYIWSQEPPIFGIPPKWNSEKKDRNPKNIEMRAKAAGKPIKVEVETPTFHKHFLMSFKGYDEPVLDGIFDYAKKATKMVDVSVAKSFRLPPSDKIFQSVFPDECAESASNKSNSPSENIVEYKLKQYERVLALDNLSGERVDVFLEFVRKALPAGVWIDVMTKDWQAYVD